ncbi:MAG TPA: hypothetical protein VGS22_03730 [Thermoanaerobaculia bacterium]|jgi:hypothetical protein|nr:hypothetical protein [Thermoanaerobaculia bacterium]
MEIDLSDLREMHPRLPEDLALVMIGRAALSLQSNGHASPVDIRLDVDGTVTHGGLTWPSSDSDFLEQHDSKRLTEDGAEAIALALSYQARGWRVVRRMQQGESADWLLEGPSKGTRQRIALEVSGVARGSITSRLTEKLAQVTKSEDVDEQWAGIVGFEEPVTALRSSKVVRP